MDKKAFKTATLHMLVVLAGTVIIGAVGWLADLLLKSGRVVAGCLLIILTILAIIWIGEYYLEKE